MFVAFDNFAAKLVISLLFRRRCTSLRFTRLFDHSSKLRLLIYLRYS